MQTDWKGNSFAFAENGAKLQISTKKKQLVFNALKYGVIWNSELLISAFCNECFEQPRVFIKSSSIVLKYGAMKVCTYVSVLQLGKFVVLLDYFFESNANFRVKTFIVDTSLDRQR